MFHLLVLFILSLTLNAKEFVIASYNVENLFDLKKQGDEYKEFIPNTKSKWSNKAFEKKLLNLLKVIKGINSDIIALQEVENKSLIKLLRGKLPEYKFISFSKYDNSSVGVGFLSKIKILANDTIKVKFGKKLYRPILESTFLFDNIKFKIFNNHWSSKKAPESYRIKYAKKLFDRIKKLPKDYDYILLGDFNSNYNEFKTIYKNKKLNDSFSITGINQVLNTTINKEFVNYEDILNFDKTVHYNLWLDLPYDKRFSSKYKGTNQTPDNILLPKSLFDNKKISYVKNSFYVFKPKYLFKNGKIFRWNIKNGVHQKSGFSDHLPIVAIFCTEKQLTIKKEKISLISQIYDKIKLVRPVILKNVIVIYKTKNRAIIKQRNDRAIFLYKNVKDLKEGFSYNIKVNKIDEYFGLKEIKKFEIINNNGKIGDYKNLYLDAKSINVKDGKYQNEIIKNLKGFYKKSKLFYNGKKIKIYFKTKKDIPKQKSGLTVKRGHLGYYKNQIQVIIYDKSDINVN